MRKQGFVVKVFERSSFPCAEVNTVFTAACADSRQESISSCGQCSCACAGKNLTASLPSGKTVTAVNKLRLPIAKGDLIEFRVKPFSLAVQTFLNFLLPLILASASFFTARIYSYPEKTCVLLSFLGFAAPLAAVVLLTKLFPLIFLPEITRIKSSPLNKRITVPRP